MSIANRSRGSEHWAVLGPAPVVVRGQVQQQEAERGGPELAGGGV